jgi:hypothetical protein
MGCWANFGWSWNLKPQGSRAVSGEFVESAIIFTYGATNVFLEHLGGSGSEWSAQDLEHVSISVMFFGAGLVSSVEVPSLFAIEHSANGDSQTVWHAPRIETRPRLAE